MTEIAVYRYRAARPDGTLESGRIDAASSAAATQLLTGRGLLPVTVRVEAGRREHRRSLSAADLALGLRVLADLLESGLPMTRALRAFEGLAPGSWKAALPHLQRAIKEGDSLAAALSSAPVEIPPLVVGLARAGEAGQGVAPAVRRAAEIAETAAATRAAVRAALAYPIVLAVAGAGSVGVLLGVVLPRFAAVLADIGQGLPPSTRFVMSAAAAARAGFVPALLTAAALLAAWRAWIATGQGRAQWHACLLAVPILGAGRLAGATARVAWALAALLESGVSMPVALKLAAEAAGDAAVERRLLRARDQITAGAPLARALAESGALTTTAVRLAQAGVESGRLAAMLAHAAKLEQGRSERITRSAVRALEPALILVFATIVALVAAALLQAVYSVRPVV
jgi:general secretion pathway protein F